MTFARPKVFPASLAAFGIAFLWIYIRTYVFQDMVLPLTYVLPLMVCVWTRMKWQVWTMAGLFITASVTKVLWILPDHHLNSEEQNWFLAATIFNSLMGAAVVHAIIRLRDGLERRNAVISAQNSELEVQAEELFQQNEEIKAQNEELEQQKEEIESQAEEASRQNEELVEANQRLNNREDILQGMLDATRNQDSQAQALGNLCQHLLKILGSPAAAVAVLQRNGEELEMVAHVMNPEVGELPQFWPLKDSLGEKVIEQDRTAYVSDFAQAPELAAPFGPSGAVRSMLATPVRMGGATRGILVVCSTVETHWTQDSFRTVEWVAAQGGLMTETAHWQQMLKDRARELEQASRAKDNFLAALSHELRTPLTPVLMAAASLSEDERLPEEVRAQLGMIERNIGLEARLIDDLLDLTRIAKGKLPLRPQLCDSHSLISLAMEIVRDDAHEKGLVLEREFLAQNCGLMADPSRFQQVIWNLLRNAVKFTPKGGKITIRTRDESVPGEAARLRIEVADTGIGITQGAIERIFQPFEQAHEGEHRFGGLGLGLSIARAIVDLHQGRISAESGGLDQGATFIVELPGATEAPAGISNNGERRNGGSPQGAAPEEMGSVPPLHILLVEDHDATLQVLTRLLIRTGYRVTSVNTITAAQSEAEANRFDLVISDLGLPDGSGNELMEKLRDQHGLRGIALSGYGMEEDVDRSRKSGFQAHLIKPIEMNQLRRTILSVLNLPETQAA
ncbi:MAG: ATP-binding protein [Verrucomicrobiota bacterium]